MSTENIKSVLIEDRLFQPDQKFTENSNFTSPAKLDELFDAAANDHTQFWADIAQQEISWNKPFTEILNDSQAPFFKWFADGLLNVSYNCIDRHLKDRGDKVAIQFEGEKGDTRQITYQNLHDEVCVFANALKQYNIAKGDRVVIYMPMIPEAVIAMQACARIGAIHSVVFGGFSAESLKDRIEDAGAKMLITADGGHRGGKIIPLKETSRKTKSSILAFFCIVIIYTFQK